MNNKQVNPKAINPININDVDITHNVNKPTFAVTFSITILNVDVSRGHIYIYILCAYVLCTDN